MRRVFGALAAVLLSCISFGPARASGDDATVILDKAIKAMGGEEKLAKISAFSWTSKGAVRLKVRANEISTSETFEGLDRVRRDFGPRTVHRMTILDGDKGWYLYQGHYRRMDAESLAKEKRNIYLQVIPTLLVPLKGPGFKYVAAADESVDGSPTSVLKVTGPDGKSFTLYFDKDSGLPVREVVELVDRDGAKRIEDTRFARYQEISGIKKATSIEVRSAGQTLGFIDITNFRILDSVDPLTFTAPGE